MLYSNKDPNWDISGHSTHNINLSMYPTKLTCTEEPPLIMQANQVVKKPGKHVAVAQTNQVTKGKALDGLYTAWQAHKLEPLERSCSSLPACKTRASPCCGQFQTSQQLLPAPVTDLEKIDQGSGQAHGPSFLHCGETSRSQNTLTHFGKLHKGASQTSNFTKGLLLYVSGCDDVTIWMRRHHAADIDLKATPNLGGGSVL